MLRLYFCCMFPFLSQNKFRLRIKINININVIEKCLKSDRAVQLAQRCHLTATALHNSKVHRSQQKKGEKKDICD